MWTVEPYRHHERHRRGRGTLVVGWSDAGSNDTWRVNSEFTHHDARRDRWHYAIRRSSRRMWTPNVSVEVTVGGRKLSIEQTTSCMLPPSTSSSLMIATIKTYKFAQVIFNLYACQSFLTEYELIFRESTYTWGNLHASIYGNAQSDSSMLQC